MFPVTLAWDNNSVMLVIIVVIWYYSRFNLLLTYITVTWQKLKWLKVTDVLKVLFPHLLHTLIISWLCIIQHWCWWWCFTHFVSYFVPKEPQVKVDVCESSRGAKSEFKCVCFFEWVLMPSFLSNVGMNASIGVCGNKTLAIKKSKFML